MIHTVARTTAFAVVTGVAALGLAGTAHAAPDSGAGALYGDPAAAAAYWQRQHYDDCGEMAVADVVGELTGSEPSEAEIIRLAEQTPSIKHAGPVYTMPPDPNNTGDGTSAVDLPVLLAAYNIHGELTHRDDVATASASTRMDGPIHDLASGQKVIVLLNGELIWGTSDGQLDANHFVVVTGVDTAAGVVHLNDSGSSSGRDEQVPESTFLQSWATSGDKMIVTTEATR